ncbi:sigma-70 family RNA polymerase sigma factor [Trinickia sp. LjRoot230]|uniref:sigma-70 family RNA polymerase sigma factor n=1 Tax=Trinickia sp. LjRoot230 TaxID=3342288 RepID=UPI003ED11607
MTQQPTDKTFDFESARARLMSIAWRMLGTRAEAEDIVQDAWLKWQAADALAVRSPVAWLTTITTRLAIDRLRRLSAEQAARENEWLPEPWRDAFIPSAEDDVLRASSLSHGLTLLFERLSADERAAFVLHEAFDCDYAQVAEVIGKNPAHCRQLVHRARERLQRPARPAFASTPNESARTRVLTRLAQTIEHGDIAGAMELFGQSTVFVAEAAPGETAVAVSPENAPVQAAAALMSAADTLGSGVFVEAQTLTMREDVGYVALLVDGQIAALLAVSFAGIAGIAGIAIGRVELVTDAVCLAAMNRMFGRRAIAATLARICSRAMPLACTVKL